MTPLHTVLTSLLTGLVMTAVAAHLALRRFRSERIWERKLDAYLMLLDALHHMRRYASQVVTRIETGSEISGGAMDELAAKSAEGRAAVRRAGVSGSLILGSDAVDRVKRLEKALDDPRGGMDIHEMASVDSELASAAIEDLRVLAEADLRGSRW